MLNVWMQVYPLYTKVINHIMLKLGEQKPSNINLVDDWIDADIIIENVVGTPDRKNLCHWREEDWSEDIKMRAEIHEGPLVYVAHCSIVDDDFFRMAFNKSKCVFGFLDFSKTVNADYNYIRMPWGVDPNTFMELPDIKERPFDIYTWGASIKPDEEGILSLYKAMKQVDGKMLHSGIDYGLEAPWYTFVPPADTYAGVAERLNRARFANALRREEGFELMGIQGALCGAKPLYFDLPCYRYWFDKFGIFVSQDNAVEDLVKVFSEDVSVPAEDKKYVIDNFSWDNVAKIFWGNILEGLS